MKWKCLRSSHRLETEMVLASTWLLLLFIPSRQETFCWASCWKILLDIQGKSVEIVIDIVCLNWCILCGWFIDDADPVQEGSDCQNQSKKMRWMPQVLQRQIIELKMCPHIWLRIFEHKVLYQISPETHLSLMSGIGCVMFCCVARNQEVVILSLIDGLSSGELCSCEFQDCWYSNSDHWSCAMMRPEANAYPLEVNSINATWMFGLWIV